MVLFNSQEYKVSSFEQRLISEIEFRLERSPVEESDEDVQHEDDPLRDCVAPFFDHKLKHFKVFEGMPVTFSCKVIGDPKPKVRGQCSCNERERGRGDGERERRKARGE